MRVQVSARRKRRAPVQPCKVHRHYLGIFKPRAECEACWRYYWAVRS